MKPVLALLCCLLPAIATAQETTGWSNWRGPDGTGAAPSGNPPTEWSEEKNIRWKIELPGTGCSSPIVWRDHLYVTSAIATDVEGEPTAQEPPTQGGERGGRSGRGGRGGRRGGRGGGMSQRSTKVHEFVVLCLDRNSGEEVWRTTVHEAVPHEGSHRTGSLASASVLTDGTHLWAFFGSRGLHCLDMKGELQWSKDLGLMQIKMSFGEGASPALYGDTLVVNWDHEGDSFIAAFDAKSGDEKWRTPRDEGTSWATPVVVPVAGKHQVIVPATGATRSYDLENGEEIWSCTGMTDNVIPTPIHDDGVIYLMSGFRGNMLQAVRLAGAKGDITGSDHILWSHNEGTSYTPSALLADGMLFFFRGNNGVLSCLDAKTGTAHYEGEKAGLRTVYSSPVSVAGRVYLTSREGMTKVIKLGPEYEEMATNQLDDTFDATAAIVGDTLYLRGRQNLYCIGEK